jgi:hypothetical protein
MTIDCHAFEELAGEVALGLVTGIERAEALAHVDECHACRATLASLTEIADEILLLAPPIAPDAGFEQRVLARIDGLPPLIDRSVNVDRAAGSSHPPRPRSLRQRYWLEGWSGT